MRDSTDEDAYDRDRLPHAYSHTMHHIKELKKERESLIARNAPGDRFGAARVAWFIRNNQNYAARIEAHAAGLGVSVRRSVDQPNGTLSAPALPAQLELFA